ncbi:MAG: glycosyltransferase [Ignavibacteria bacterium]|nr:glycosyltransferase [Ignavibacteria bacterium]
MKLIPKPYNYVKSERIVPENESYYPAVTFVISASGEPQRIIKEKIENTQALIYPREKLEVVFAIAYDTSKEVDETIDEFYKNFLIEPDLKNTTSKDEEIYLKFSKYENSGNLRSANVLTEIEQHLEGESFTTDDISLEGKKNIDRHIERLSSEDEIDIKITKDIERKGKISQVNRTVEKANGEILVFSDANSYFNKEALINLTKHFADKQVGCVAGEKRVKKSEHSTSGEGEGLYWKYESLLKKIDSKLWTCVGAAGEIFAIRKNLWGEGVAQNTLIEDFVVSMKVAEKGYRVIYEPEAYAEEEPTVDMKEEYIRRRRIAAGGFQAIVILKSLFNIFKYRILSFQYISHRVLRWAVVPFIIPLALILNIYLLINSFSYLYFLTLLVQISFYIFALFGFILEKQKKKVKLFNIPYVLFVMNYSAYIGLKRYITGEQKVIWERVKR